MNRPRFSRWTALALLIVLLSWGAWTGFRRVHVALEAERTHHTYRQTLEAITLYLEHHNLHWPPNLESLATFAVKQDPMSFDHLSDLAELRRRVSVRFDLATEAIVNVDAREFSAVRPIEPHFGEDLSAIERLLEVSRGDNN
jgi:hypothetical protein